MAVGKLPYKQEAEAPGVPWHLAHLLDNRGNSHLEVNPKFPHPLRNGSSLVSWLPALNRPTVLSLPLTPQPVAI